MNLAVFMKFNFKGVFLQNFGADVCHMKLAAFVKLIGRRKFIVSSFIAIAVCFAAYFWASTSHLSQALVSCETSPSIKENCLVSPSNLSASVSTINQLDSYLNI